jgi:hypothetical protein
MIGGTHASLTLVSALILPACSPTQPGVPTGTLAAGSSSSEGVGRTVLVRSSVPGSSIEEVGARTAAMDEDNQAPHVVFKVSPAPVDGRILGGSPMEIEFNMCRSLDPEDDRLLFSMDADGDGRNDEVGTHGGNCRRTFTYEAAKGEARDWSASVCVTDVDSGGRPRHDAQCRTYSITVYGPPSEPFPAPPASMPTATPVPPCAFTTQGISTWLATGSAPGNETCSCPTYGTVLTLVPGFHSACLAAGFNGAGWRQGLTCYCS